MTMLWYYENIKQFWTIWLLCDWSFLAAYKNSAAYSMPDGYAMQKYWIVE